MEPDSLEGYPQPGHHPTKWAKYYLMKCADCGFVAPARVALTGQTAFQCASNSNHITYDTTFGNNGFVDTTGEEAEKWDYDMYFRSDTQLIARLELVKTRAIQRGELIGQTGEQQLSLL